MLSLQHFLQESYDIADVATIVCQPMIVSEFNRFFSATGPARIFISYIPTKDMKPSSLQLAGHNTHTAHPPSEARTRDGSNSTVFKKFASTRDSAIAPPDFSLRISDSTPAVLGQKCVYFARRDAENQPISEFTFMDHILCGEIGESICEDISSSMSLVCLPMLEATTEWGECSSDEIQSFLASAEKFTSSIPLQEAETNRDLKLETPELLLTPDMKLSRHVASILEDYETHVESWIKIIEKLLSHQPGIPTAITTSDMSAFTSVSSVSSDIGVVASPNRTVSGPITEVNFWRTRQRNLFIITEQLKSRECQIVIGLLIAQQSKLLKRWKGVDSAITDASNESKDINKLLDAFGPLIDSLHDVELANIQRPLTALPAVTNKVAAMLVRTNGSTLPLFLVRFLSLCGEQLAIIVCQHLSDPYGAPKWRTLPSDIALAQLQHCTTIISTYKEALRPIVNRLDQFVSPKTRESTFVPTNSSPGLFASTHTSLGHSLNSAGASRVFNHAISTQSFDVGISRAVSHSLDPALASLPADLISTVFASLEQLTSRLSEIIEVVTLRSYVQSILSSTKHMRASFVGALSILRAIVSAADECLSKTSNTISLRDHHYSRTSEMGYLKFAGAVAHQEEVLKRFIDDESQSHESSLETLEMLQR